jgi:hypothetical protein
MQRDVISTNRVDFQGDSTLDGSLLLQILRRLRNVEEQSGGGSGGGGTSSDARIIVPYTVGIPLESAVNNILVTFSSNDEITVGSSAFVNSAVGSFYNFGNLGTKDVHITNGTTIILSIVPGEFTSLVKMTNGWYGTLGLI